jgi:uncharacterized damage-inducible protein DinB
MHRLLSDLYGHQSWADAEHWRAIGASQRAREDRAILDRLHHIHLVQSAFLWATGDRSAQFSVSKPGDFAGFEELREYARNVHARVARLIERLGDARLAESITMPWFNDPPLTLSVAEALTQAAMHSHYHRGQNATRLRELGVEPPTTDLIIWYWKGRPEPGMW